MNFEDVIVRAATHKDRDIAVVNTFIRDLAKEEGLLAATATRDDLTVALFDENRIAHAVIAMIDTQPAGFALCYPKYATGLLFQHHAEFAADVDRFLSASLWSRLETHTR